MRHQPHTIFVFGSNLAGRHGAGAAKTAKEMHRAKAGIGVGMTGDAYAIPTKGMQLEVLPLDTIKLYVSDFLKFARNNPHLQFTMTKIGCGLAGYTPAQIAPMFVGYPANVKMPSEFLDVLKSI